MPNPRLHLSFGAITKDSLLWEQVFLESLLEHRLDEQPSSLILFFSAGTSYSSVCRYSALVPRVALMLAAWLARVLQSDVPKRLPLPGEAALVPRVIERSRA